MYTQTIKNAVLLLIACLVICSISCRKDEKSNPDTPKKTDLKEGINLTIFAFNNGIKYKKNFTLVDEKSADTLKSWINHLEIDDGTALFSTMDNAIDALKNTNVPKDFNGLFLVTFTDGLDNASVGFNSNYDNRA